MKFKGNEHKLLIGEWYYVSNASTEQAEEYKKEIDTKYLFRWNGKKFENNIVEGCFQFDYIVSAEEHEHIITDFRPLTLDNLPKDIDFRKAPISQYDIEWSIRKGKWEKICLSSTEWEDIIKKIREGIKHRYRQLPKKETAEEAADRIWEDKSFPENFTYLPSVAYKDGFKDGSEWKEEQSKKNHNT